MRHDQPAIRHALLISVFLTAGLSGCGDKPPAQVIPPSEVKFIVAETTTVPVVREYVGNVVAYRSVQVRARVEGVLTKRHYTEGTNVKEGQLLYSIDPDNYEAAQRDAQAALAQAEANLANAKAREGRYAPLAKEDAISKQDYDDAVTQLRQAESSVQSARAQLDRAKLNLGYTQIRAAETGRIGFSQVPEGALVGKGEPTLLATIEKLDPIYVNFTMPDRDALMLQRAFRSGAIKEQGGENVRMILPDVNAPLTRAMETTLIPCIQDAWPLTNQTQAIEFLNMHKAIFKNCFCNTRISTGNSIQSHELSLHIGRKGGVF
jgi:membrane fusion protein (multidrug efflux system)